MKKRWSSCKGVLSIVLGDIAEAFREGNRVFLSSTKFNKHPFACFRLQDRNGTDTKLRCSCQGVSESLKMHVLMLGLHGRAKCWHECYEGLQQDLIRKYYHTLDHYEGWGFILWEFDSSDRGSGGKQSPDSSRSSTRTDMHRLSWILGVVVTQLWKVTVARSWRSGQKKCP